MFARRQQYCDGVIVLLMAGVSVWLDMTLLTEAAELYFTGTALKGSTGHLTCTATTSDEEQTYSLTLQNKHRIFKKWTNTGGPRSGKSVVSGNPRYEISFSVLDSKSVRLLLTTTKTVCSDGGEFICIFQFCPSGTNTGRDSCVLKAESGHKSSTLQNITKSMIYFVEDHKKYPRPPQMVKGTAFPVAEGSIISRQYKFSLGGTLSWTFQWRIKRQNHTEVIPPDDNRVVSSVSVITCEESVVTLLTFKATRTDHRALLSLFIYLKNSTTHEMICHLPRGICQSVTLDVHYGVRDPIVTLQKVPSQQKMITLSCYADGNPLPVYRWVKVISTKGIREEHHLLSKTNSLSLVAPPQNETFYACIAENILLGNNLVRNIKVINIAKLLAENETSTGVPSNKEEETGIEGYQRRLLVLFPIVLGIFSISWCLYPHLKVEQGGEGDNDIWEIISVDLT